MATRRTTEPPLLVSGANVVRELLGSAHPVDRVWVRAGAARDLAERAAARRVPVEQVGAEVLSRLLPGGAHQGVVARVPAFRYAELGDVLDDPGRAVVVLDGVQDPQNLGAIVRTARAAGVAGVVLPRDRAAAVTAAVASAAAGHVFCVPVVRVTNVTRACEMLKDAGRWLVALVADAERSIFEVAAGVDRPVLVVGGEGAGLRPLVRRTCDLEASIPMAAGVESLNVSVATGIALYSLTRNAPVV